MKAAWQLDFEPLQPSGDHNFNGHGRLLSKERVLFLSLKPGWFALISFFDCFTIKKVIGCVSHSLFYVKNDQFTRKNPERINNTEINQSIYYHVPFSVKVSSVFQKTKESSQLCKVFSPPPDCHSLCCSQQPRSPYRQSLCHPTLNMGL